jgi:MFS family permease
MRNAPESRPPMRRIAIASMVGTTIEFYDFTVFAIAAALVFSQVFFPALGDSAGLAVSLATFGVAFVARPFGSILFGHFGDRIGRKNTLVWTLLLMGAATLCIGLLPTAESIGPVAAILLVILRLVQGLALGGEWAGASLLMAENAPAGKRGFYGLFPQLGPALGFILSSVTFLITASVMSTEAFLSWGWRIPFLASAALIVVGLFVRISLEETVSFRKAVAERRTRTARIPIHDLFRHQWRELALATGGSVAIFAFFYMAVAFLGAFGQSEFGFTQNFVLMAGIIGGVSLTITTIASAIASDVWGRRSVLLGGNIGLLVMSVALIPILNIGSKASFVLAAVLLQAVVGVAYGPMATFLPELFSTRYRYTGAGLAYNMATVLGAALTPIIAVRLNDRFGPGAIGLYLFGVSLVTTVSLYKCRETRGRVAATESMTESAPVADRI